MTTIQGNAPVEDVIEISSADLVKLLPARTAPPETGDVLVISMGRLGVRERKVMAEGLKTFFHHAKSLLESHREMQLSELARSPLSLVTLPALDSLELSRELSRQRAREQVLGSASWWNAHELREKMGSHTSNPHALPSKWKRERKIFTLQIDGVEHVPAYLLDPDAGYRPRPIVKTILDVFGGQWSDWELANWFASANGYLAGGIGKAPMDCLGGNAAELEELVVAAKAAAGDHLHG